MNSCRAVARTCLTACCGAQTMERRGDPHTHYRAHTRAHAYTQQNHTHTCTRTGTEPHAGTHTDTHTHTLQNITLARTHTPALCVVHWLGGEQMCDCVAEQMLVTSCSVYR
ncbi:unnamed protein product [Boreogadus saida]